MSVDFYALWWLEGSECFGESVNCSNVNGRAILELLGYDTSELAGDDSPDEFLAKVRRAAMRVGNVSGSDDGKPWTEGCSARGVRWTDCGRRPGYFAERLPELEAVARQAKRHGGMVCWA